MRVLVVDDNADGREMVRTLLEVQGYEIHEAAEGHAAVTQALALQPDAAIIDIGLPGIDGYAVAAGIRAEEKGSRRMRLIALTGYGAEADRRRAAQAGFDAHLTKPCDPYRLVRLLAAESIDEIPEAE
jgi:CheY-like chemotaxis protein